jgi:hypothetical protein
MRKTVSEAFLRDEISAHMAGHVMSSGTFWSRPIRCKRTGDGPNWRLSFNPGAVPAGYTAAWESIRPSFENQFDMADD